MLRRENFNNGHGEKERTLVQRKEKAHFDKRERVCAPLGCNAIEKRKRESMMAMERKEIW
jgi:hypothetical protein